MSSLQDEGFGVLGAPNTCCELALRVWALKVAGLSQAAWFLRVRGGTSVGFSHGLSLSAGTCLGVGDESLSSPTVSLCSDSCEAGVSATCAFAVAFAISHMVLLARTRHLSLVLPLARCALSWGFASLTQLMHLGGVGMHIAF